MNPEELRKRTRRFALDVIRFYQTLPKSSDAQILGRQLLKSGTGVGANYRASCIARSKSEFVSRLAVALEEADESAYWLELLEDGGIRKDGEVRRLRQEACELAAIFGASLRTAKASLRSQKDLQNDQ